MLEQPALSFSNNEKKNSRMVFIDFLSDKNT